MWKRLSDAEIATFDEHEAMRRRSVWLPALNTALIALLGIASYVFGFRVFSGSGSLYFIEQGRSRGTPTIVETVVFVLVFGGLFGFAYRKQRRTGRQLLSVSASSMICTKCRNLTEAGMSKNCSCGGALETMDHWEWVDDPPDENSA